MSSSPCPPADPKVSVAMITYNHAAFIVQAVESVVSQVTTFPFEVVIGDDLSTDGTRELVIELQKKYPDRIRLLLHPTNLGLIGKKNFVTTLQACRGEYIAYLEGDDYWAVTDKLQRQVDFMEPRPELVGCIHDIQMLSNGTELSLHRMEYPPESERLGLAEFLRYGFPHLMTMLIRRRYLPAFQPWFYEVAMGDWSVFALLGKQGLIAFIRDWPVGVYRLHGTSYWLGRPFVDRSLDEIKAYRILLQEFGPQFRSVLETRINRHQFWLTYAYLEKGDTAGARAAFQIAAAGWLRHRGVSFIDLIRYTLSVYAPWLRTGLRRVRRSVLPSSNL